MNKQLVKTYMNLAQCRAVGVLVRSHLISFDAYEQLKKTLEVEFNRLAIEIGRDIDEVEAQYA